MKATGTVLVSGCYDILHGGHVQFLEDAAALGDRLVVVLSGEDVLIQHKERCQAMPTEHKVVVLNALECVDEVIVSPIPDEMGLDFMVYLWAEDVDILAVTEDDRYVEQKRALCRERGITYVQLPKRLDYPPISTTEIRERCSAPQWVPLRVDFAGGWLDVPSLAREGAFVVNCAITPGLSLKNNWAQPGSGLGGSAAWAILNAKDGVAAELKAGVGWQDPAVILETGLCVWRSGARPELEMKDSGDWLNGLMALKYLGGKHTASDLAGAERDFDAIVAAGDMALEAVRTRDINLLADAVNCSCAIQCAEPMPLLGCFGERGAKYAGSGHGGYAMYLFASKAERDGFVADTGAVAVEPYCRWRASRGSEK